MRASPWMAGRCLVFMSGRPDAPSTSPQVMSCWFIRKKQIHGCLVVDRGEPARRWGAFMVSWKPASLVVEVERLQGRLRGDLVLLWGRIVGSLAGTLPTRTLVGTTSQTSVGRSSIIDYHVPTMHMPYQRIIPYSSQGRSTRIIGYLDPSSTRPEYRTGCCHCRCIAGQIRSVAVAGSEKDATSPQLLALGNSLRGPLARNGCPRATTKLQSNASTLDAAKEPGEANANHNHLFGQWNNEKRDDALGYPELVAQPELKSQAINKRPP